MNTLKPAMALLTAVLCVVCSSAFGHGAPYNGWSGAPGGMPAGFTPSSAEELEPADQLSVDEEYPGQHEDGPCFGEWGPKDAGAAKPGLGAPWSGIRPPVH
jgi:hypothetical protein